MIVCLRGNIEVDEHIAAPFVADYVLRLYVSVKQGLLLPMHIY